MAAAVEATTRPPRGGRGGKHRQKAKLNQSLQQLAGQTDADAAQAYVDTCLGVYRKQHHGDPAALELLTRWAGRAGTRGANPDRPRAEPGGTAYGASAGWKGGRARRGGRAASSCARPAPRLARAASCARPPVPPSSSAVTHPEPSRIQVQTQTKYQPKPKPERKPNPNPNPNPDPDPDPNLNPKPKTQNPKPKTQTQTPHHPQAPRLPHWRRGPVPPRRPHPLARPPRPRAPRAGRQEPHPHLQGVALPAGGGDAGGLFRRRRGVNGRAGQAAGGAAAARPEPLGSHSIP